MSNYKRSSGKTRLRVGGDMSPEGADKAGLTLARAALYTGVMFGAAALVGSVGFLVRSMTG